MMPSFVYSFSEVKYCYQPIKVTLANGIIKVLSLFILIRVCHFHANSTLSIYDSYEANVVKFDLHFSSKITNTNFFQTTQELEFNWVIEGDGCKLASGILSLPTLDPQSSYDIKWESGLWYPSWNSFSTAETFLTITANLLRPSRWLQSGHVVSSQQLELPLKKDFISPVGIILEVANLARLNG